MSNFILSLNYSVRVISLKDHEAILYVIVSHWNFQRAPMIPPFLSLHMCISTSMTVVFYAILKMGRPQIVGASSKFLLLGKKTKIKQHLST